MTRATKSNGVTGNVREAVSKNPAAERLVGELESYARNRMLGLVDSLGDRIGDAADRLEDFAANGGPVKKAAKNMSDGDSPLMAGAKAVGSTVKDKLGGMLGGNGNGGNSSKATLIEESVDVGVPVSVAYNQWTQFQQFAEFAKGVQSVSQEDDATTTWRAKVAFSTRSWQAKITEQIPDQRIAWTSDGDKGSVNGVVTFHELAPNLTRVLLELEYHPKGFMEKTGNLWRAQGRRARLDLKHFRWFVMSNGEESGAWRGEIHDGDGSRRRRRPDAERSASRRGRARRARRSSQRADRRSRRPAREHSDTAGDEPRGAEADSDERDSPRRRPAGRKRAERKQDAAESGGAAGDTQESTSPEKSASPRRPRRAPARKKPSARKNTSARNTTTARRASSPRTTARKTSPSKTTPSKTTPSKTSRSTTSPTKTSSSNTSSRKKTAAAKTSSPAKKASPRKRTAAKKTAATRKSTSRRKSTATRKRAGSK